jgi:hypothetical protein
MALFGLVGYQHIQTGVLHLSSVQIIRWWPDMVDDGGLRSLPPDKAPGPDGFTGRFLQVTRPIIRADVMAAFDEFCHLDTRNMHNVNDALLVLLPKSTEAITVKDFCPISLIHVIGKLVSKVLSNNLAPRLSELVRVNQSAFVKGRAIHDSFKMVQLSAKLLHTRRKPSMLLKIDIAQAFDSVAWPFLLEVWLIGVTRSRLCYPLPAQRCC